ncbi:class I SAM-dependent methyltransferase [Legionella fallonii]|uniref:Methylase involved in ubiquinone/menaquinone biosynthesis n=1 Tax=Legionella fallonii LLAP-10 TaxID=1212491 RepID=A0A098G3U3_9GAMM|nr:class I SAM-dependent methyltransferase [Legionella fallonii]CEG56649.1 Methylase involved in ubiquinone/menaquinone biosynthesis [Legionella fallonii LLAP-10]
MNEVSREYIKHFNQQSDQYLLCRPDYPQELFDYFAQLVAPDASIWDCGTGNGQAAKELATRFSKVIATDINQKQLDVANKAPNIDYICAPAEHTPIQADTISLVTVAQALHWFKFPEFYQEVKRVSKTGGYIAAWCYSLGFFGTDLDKVIKKLYYDILGAEFWPRERFYIDEQYQTIPFPFHKISTPQWFIDKKITFNELIGYLSTWSAVKEYQARQQRNPIELIYSELQSFWGDEQEGRMIRWPIHCLLGKVHD